MKERKQDDLPALGARTADTHAHLDMLDDPAGALERAAVAGVMLVATVADVTEAPLGTFDALPVWNAQTAERMDEWGIPHAEPPEVRIIVGVHPHNAKGYTERVATELHELAADDRVVAIGETGLDFHYDHSPREFQVKAFRAQLELAHELGLPVAVHLREAHQEGLKVLREVGVPAKGCIIHCFTEGPKTAQLFLEMGCHISFSGTITFKNAGAARDAARLTPLERLLVETDCPFMTPEPFRGRSNEPAFVTFSVERLAAVREAETAEIASACMDNARLLFGLDG
jgi:TatD DNase family protein